MEIQSLTDTKVSRFEVRRLKPLAVTGFFHTYQYRIGLCIYYVHSIGGGGVYLGTRTATSLPVTAKHFGPQHSGYRRRRV